jgi:two-component system sensor histidine kinase AlgZ
MAPSTLLQWLARVALLTGGALPATLAWLIAACSLKHPAAGACPPAASLQRAWCWGHWRALCACAMLSLVGVAVAAALAGQRGQRRLAVGRCWWRRWCCAHAGSTPAATTARLTELQSRIRPHFLFNTLNSAIALVREEPAKAESLLEDLSDLFRHALVEQGEAVTLAEEIQLARRYLAIEQVRFGERLQVQWHLDPRTNNCPACPRCCCNRWWKTPSSTAWSPAPAAASCAC